MKRFVLMVVAAVLALGTESAITAHAVTPSCLTSVTTFASDPDNGNHGLWANDNFKRTTKICEVSPGSYTATVTDKGTFTSIKNAQSPNAGANIDISQTGSFNGGFTATFTSEAAFDDYHAAFNNQTLTGNVGPGTSNWVKAFFTDMDATDTVATDFSGSSINNDWSWTYKTCSQQWIDSSTNSDGNLPADGDITGEPCATPTPTATPESTPTPTPTPTPTATPTPSGGTSTTLSVLPSPPVTGDGSGQ